MQPLVDREFNTLAIGNPLLKARMEEEKGMPRETNQSTQFILGWVMICGTILRGVERTRRPPRETTKGGEVVLWTLMRRQARIHELAALRIQHEETLKRINQMEEKSQCGQAIS